MNWLIVVALLASGCSSKPPGGPITGSDVQATGTDCDGLRAKVEQLYRAAARDREPARVNEAVADNTTMVMNDCVKAPGRVTACITAATTVQELEARCLEPIDD